MRANEWQPMEDAAAVHGRVGSAFAAVGAEWLGFVQRRLEHDAALYRELADAKAPADVWHAYQEFWSRAASDYQGEAMELTKLGIAAAVACPFAVEDCARRLGRDHKAARRS